MNLDYSPKERYQKIVSILADGVLSIIRREQKTAAFIQDSIRLSFGKIMSKLAKDKKCRAYTISSSFGEVAVQKNRQRRYVEQHGKTYFSSVTISRD